MQLVTITRLCRALSGSTALVAAGAVAAAEAGPSGRDHPDQARPRHITREDFESRYPRVTVRVLQGNIAVEKPGRIVGRTVAGAPRYDVRLEDGTMLPNRAADEVIFPEARAA